MSNEDKELLQSMILGFLQDLRYQFDLTTDEQAKKLLVKELETMK